MFIITAVSSRGEFGLNGGLPWRIKKDLAFFKEQTMGKTLLVGKRTSLPPLRGRTVIHLDRETDLSLYPDAYLIGGKTVIEALQHLATRWYLTVITFPREIQSDTYFYPDLTGWTLVSETFSEEWCSLNQCFALVSFKQYERTPSQCTGSE